MDFSEPGQDLSAPMVYGKKPSRKDPAQLVRAHMQLVRKIAWHVHGRVSTALDVEDLIQIGMIALVEAANAYEDRGHAFSTYSTLRIRGAMIDHLRRQATICRSAMARKRQLSKLIEKFEKQFGRAPTESEIATEMGIDTQAVRELIEATQSVHYESLDDMYSDHSMWFADQEEQADDKIEREQLADLLTDQIANLPEKEALVLQLYFVEEMNLEEIGQTIGVGAARVCQIKKSAIDRLRRGLADRD